MIGLPCSCSRNACIIRFLNGPYHGEEGLFDHPYSDSISFSHSGERVTHEYVPVEYGVPVYKFKRTYRWST